MEKTDNLKILLPHAVIWIAAMPMIAFCILVHPQWTIEQYAEMGGQLPAACKPLIYVITIGRLFGLCVFASLLSLALNYVYNKDPAKQYLTQLIFITAWQIIVFTVLFTIAVPSFNVGKLVSSDGNNTRQIKERIRLLPTATENNAAGRLRDVMVTAKQYTLDEIEDPALIAVATNTAFAEWKKHKDEYISFKYPDNTNITLAIEHPKNQNKDANNSPDKPESTFTRKYTITLGKHLYSSITLDKANNFIDNPCLCAPIVFKKYLSNAGILYRFDLFEDGSVQKIQMLNNGLRAELFQSSHSLIEKDVYIDIALSIWLSYILQDEGYMKTNIINQQEFEGALGFIEKGMSRSNVVALLGTPSTETDDSITYVQTENGWQETTIIPFTTNVFHSFNANWHTSIQVDKEGNPIKKNIEDNMDDPFEDNDELETDDPFAE